MINVNRDPISVCIASYNGEKYIVDQLSSIIKQLEVFDEVIIVDDCSNDNTLALIRSIKDSRIKLFSNKNNKGQVFAFSKAISLSTNKYIFLADQDDIWTDRRLNLMYSSLKGSNKQLISTNFLMFKDQSSDSFESNYPLFVNSSNDNFKNIYRLFLGKADYFGCTMAFNSNLKNLILPIPGYVECHDWWLAIISNLMKCNMHLEFCSVLRRIHENNFTNPNRNILYKIKSRFIFIIMIFHIFYRINFKK